MKFYLILLNKTIEAKAFLHVSLSLSFSVFETLILDLLKVALATMLDIWGLIPQE